MSPISSFSAKSGGEGKTATFNASFPSGLLPRGVKRSIEEVDFNDDDVERRGHPVWDDASRPTSALTSDVNMFTPAALWASPWGSHSVYDEWTENAMTTNIPVEGIASSPTMTSDLYMEITRVISRLIEGSITQNDLIEALQRVASQLKHWD